MKYAVRFFLLGVAIFTLCLMRASDGDQVKYLRLASARNECDWVVLRNRVEAAFGVKLEAEFASKAAHIGNERKIKAAFGRYNDLESIRKLIIKEGNSRKYIKFHGVENDGLKMSICKSTNEGFISYDFVLRFSDKTLSDVSYTIATVLRNELEANPTGQPKHAEEQ